MLQCSQHADARWLSSEMDFHSNEAGRVDGAEAGDISRSNACSAKCLSVKAASLRQQELRYAP
jgi:hypothetical protein